MIQDKLLDQLEAHKSIPKEEARSMQAEINILSYPQANSLVMDRSPSPKQLYALELKTYEWFLYEVFEIRDIYSTW